MSHHLRIVFADDERDSREYFLELLPRLGHQAHAVENGRQLVELGRAVEPDLIITDVRIPDLDGIAASTAINQEREVPVILVSAHHEAELLERAVTGHVMAYLVKPVREEQVGVAIPVAMLRFHQYLALRKEAADVRQALEDRKVVERAKGALVRYVGVDEEEAYRRLRKMASDGNKKLCEVARDVIASAEVFHSLEQADAGKAGGGNGRHAHGTNGPHPASAHRPRRDHRG